MSKYNDVKRIAFKVAEFRMAFDNLSTLEQKKKFIENLKGNIHKNPEYIGFLDECIHKYNEAEEKRRQKESAVEPTDRKEIEQLRAKFNYLPTFDGLTSLMDASSIFKAKKSFILMLEERLKQRKVVSCAYRTFLNECKQTYNAEVKEYKAMVDGEKITGKTPSTRSSANVASVLESLIELQTAYNRYDELEKEKQRINKELQDWTAMRDRIQW